jgi:hypothetical protein
MRVLVATDIGQGDQPGDYSWTLDGEIVMLPILECGDPERCGCGRAFAGMTSHKATTTALIVEDKRISPGRLADLIGDAWLDQGYVRTDDWREAMVQEVEIIQRITGTFGLGFVVGRHGTEIYPRRWLRAGERPPEGRVTPSP